MELPEAYDGGEMAPPEMPTSRGVPDRPGKIQRKIGPPARRTAVALPKSQPIQPVTETGEFEVVIWAPKGTRLDRATLDRIILANKPAHTTYKLEVVNA